MGKKKNTKKQTGEAVQSQASEDIDEIAAAINDIELASKQPTKKGKKTKKVVDNWEDEIQDEILKIATGEETIKEETVTNAPADQTKGKKKGKKKADKDDNWEDEIQDEISKIANGEEEAIKDEAVTNASANKTKGKKKGKKKAEKDDNWEDEVRDEISKIATGEEPVNKNKADEAVTDATTSKIKGKKKGKKKADKDDNWEDDVLNEIALLESGEAPEQDNKNDDKPTKKPKKQRKPETNDKKIIEEKPALNPAPTLTVTNKEPEPTENVGEEAESETTSSKKKRPKKKKAAEAEEKKKKPNKAIKAMQEALRKRKEEEEKFKREEEERIRKEEEAYQRKLEEIERERLRKEKKKQDKKDKILRQKKEGTYLTPAQKEANRRREAFLQHLRDQGIEVPSKEDVGPTKKPKYEKKKKQPVQETKPVVEEAPVVVEEPQPVEEVEEVASAEVSETEADWEDIAEEPRIDKQKEATLVEEGEETDEDESSEEEDEEESESEEDDKDLSPREKTIKRIEKLRETNEADRSVDDLRSPVICVMGHVDTGKTKILDKIRHSNVQDGEAGGITQQIGATNIPVSVIKDQTSMVKNFSDIKVPGLLVIDTPGHESFSNLRSRGSSNCDFAILVVDIMHGLEPQTIESINMLRKKKTPYVVALNKIDRLYEWKSSPKTDVATTIKNQKKYTKDEFQDRVNETIVQFAKQGLNAKLFYENDDPDTWISMVPTSAHSGDGMGNLMAYVVQHCQSKLAKRLAFSENLQCTVLEVKAIQGLGTTVDVILTNGRLKYGDTIVLAGVEGPIVTHVKGLLMPQPLKELRVKNPYDKFSEIKAAQGVKVLAKELDKALAGTSLLVAKHDDEIEILKEEVQAEVDQALRSIKLQERGVFVQASTLGSLEALLEFLKQSKIPYAGIGIGPIHKRDVMKASVMLEHDDQWAVILAFDVKVEREAQELADNLGVRIFTADIIYHLFDAFMQHREDLKKQKQDQFRHLAVFPCKLKIVPNCVFKSRDPIVVGVTIEAGQLRVGTPICVPSKEFLNVGVVASIESNHKPVEIARKPQEVCIKIDGTPGEAPKMVGRHFDEADVLTSKISRESIDLLKDWFRDDMQKSDWQLVIELKKLFEII